MQPTQLQNLIKISKFEFPRNHKKSYWGCLTPEFSLEITYDWKLAHEVGSHGNCDFQFSKKVLLF